MKTEVWGVRLARLLLFWFAGNLTAFFAIVHFAVGWKILIGILTGIAFLFFQFFHPHTVAGEKKLALWSMAVIYSEPEQSGLFWNASQWAF